jgi:hypothetical protein
MIYPVPFEAPHYAQMAVHDSQAWLSQHATVETLSALEGPYAGTLMRDGAPLVCGGAWPMWEGRAVLWAFFDTASCRKDFRVIHGYAKTFLSGLPFRRLEAAVVVDFEQGHRWVRALGFECETPPPARMKAYQVDGADCLLYSLVKEAA